MRDLFAKNSFFILENPHTPGTRSWHAWNVWIRVVRSGLLGEVDISDAPGKEFERLTSKCGRNSGRRQMYAPKIYREVRERSFGDSLI